MMIIVWEACFLTSLATLVCSLRWIGWEGVTLTCIVAAMVAGALAGEFPYAASLWLLGVAVLAWCIDSCRIMRKSECDAAEDDGRQTGPSSEEKASVP